MGAFTQPELDCLQGGRRLARMATADVEGQPHRERRTCHDVRPVSICRPEARLGGSTVAGVLGSVTTRCF